MPGLDDIQPLQTSTPASQQLASLLSRAGASAGSEPGSAGFAQALQGATHNLGHVQKGAQQALKQVARGADGEVHDSMMAIEKANTSFKFAFTCIKKAIETYKEVTQRMG